MASNLAYTQRGALFLEHLPHGLVWAFPPHMSSHGLRPSESSAFKPLLSRHALELAPPTDYMGRNTAQACLSGIETDLA